MEQSTRSVFRKTWRFIKIFVSVGIVVHVLLFFIMNRAVVDRVNFIYADLDDILVRWVILASMVAGGLLMLALLWIHRLLTKRQ